MLIKEPTLLWYFTLVRYFSLSKVLRFLWYFTLVTDICSCEPFQSLSAALPLVFVSFSVRQCPHFSFFPQYSNLCHPETSWAPLSPELHVQSYMLGARQILVGSLLQVKCKIKETLHFPRFYLIPVFFSYVSPMQKKGKVLWDGCWFVFSNESESLTVMKLNDP